MAMYGWSSVTSENPCPKCGGPDNCTVSDDGEWCYCGHLELGSNGTNARGQHLHRLKDTDGNSTVPRRTRPPAQVKGKRKSPLKDHSEASGPQIVHAVYDSISSRDLVKADELLVQLKKKHGLRLTRGSRLGSEEVQHD